ncbi:peptide-methionine (S)-S-oxide reductase MsrA [Pedobacter sp. ASV12]|uniref:peptide-methionine (S)-S-oxide reductase MsrA n=1 Tax=Pedobacter sp. ASV12 TaxID=2795120 RepID=UPI0018EA8534|nr:peptide-methionine (S)-S-oxide reductase MsrA [Pedobacter sp. ASV12]
MKRLSVILMLLLTLAACSSGEDKKPATLPKPSAKEQVATFAGGCFWSIQEGFSELKGVIKATSGYAGGTTKNPTYEQVGTEQTGHAESVQVVYDPNVISFSQLLDAFFVMHDPTQLNRQGPDIGTSYRSIAFYNNAEEQKQIEAAIAKYNRMQFHPGEIVTEVKPFEVFYPAEKYHQNYVRLNPNQAYVANVCGPKVEKLRKALPGLIKDEFK